MCLTARRRTPLHFLAAKNSGTGWLLWPTVVSTLLTAIVDGAWWTNTLYKLRGRHVAIDLSEEPTRLSTTLDRMQNLPPPGDDEGPGDDGEDPGDHHGPTCCASWCQSKSRCSSTWFRKFSSWSGAPSSSQCQWKP